MSIKEEKKFALPLNLQFFAEGGEGEEDKQDDKAGTEDKKKDNQDKGDTSKTDNKKPVNLEELLSDENFNKEFQSAMDKRVTEALKKQEQKLKKAFEDEQKKAQMTEEEKKQAEQEQIEQERKAREIQLKARELKLDLIDVLEEEGLDTGFRDLIDVSPLLSIEDKDSAKEELKAKVKKVKGTFNSLVEKKVEEVKKEYLKGNTPNQVGKENNNTPPNEYEKAKKEGNVRGMLASKFANFGG